MSESCIFCRIVKGELPACKVLETSDTLAFMDINPVIKGHALVIPKAHHNPITDVPDALLGKVLASVKQVAAAQLRGLGADGVNVTQANGEIAGQIVPHVHFHVIPRFEKSENPRNWIPGKYGSPDEMESYGSRIRAAVRPAP